MVQGIDMILKAVEAGGPALVLENSAGSGDGIGSSIEDLADLVDLAAAEESTASTCASTRRTYGRPAIGSMARRARRSW